MGASSREIEEQIKETRERMDENLEVLEHRAASSAVRYGKIAAVVVGAAAVAGAGFLLWRRTRRPTLKGRLEKMSPDSLRALADELATRLKKPLPSVKVTVNEKSQEPGTWESILRKVAPALAGTASTAFVERVTRAPDDGRNSAAPQAD